MIIPTIPKAVEIATAARAEAQEQYAGMKHSSRLTPKGATAKLERLIRASAERRTAEITKPVLDGYRWTYEQIQQQSSIDFPTVGMRHHPAHLLSMFQAGDIIWCGEVHEAGERNFRTRDEWL